MASDGFMNKNWEKLLVVGAVAIFGVAVFLSMGYFAVSEPDVKVQRLREAFNANVSGGDVPVQPPEPTGVADMEMALAVVEEPALPPAWSLYDYKGTNFTKREKAKPTEYSLPNLDFEGSLSEATGEVLLTWKPTVTRGLPRATMFEMHVHRFSLAAGKDSAKPLQPLSSLSGSFSESIGKSFIDGVEAIQPGRSYGYFLTAKLKEDVLLSPGGKGAIETDVITISVPTRFTVEGLQIQSGRRTKKFVRASVLGEAPVTVEVSRKVNEEALPLELSEEQAEILGVDRLPIRPKSGQRAFRKNLEIYDLQSRAFGIFPPAFKLEEGMLPNMPMPGEGGGTEEGGTEEGGEKAPGKMDGEEEGGEMEKQPPPAEKPERAPPPKEDDDPFK